MASDLNSLNLFNPMAYWTDLGLRALDTAVSSSQDIGDGVDRLARVRASAEPADPVAVVRSAPGERSGPAADFGLGLALRMQRTALDLMTQGWEQWISTLGTLASLGAGRSFRDAVASQNPWLNTLREKLVSEAEAAEARAGSRGSSPRQRGDGPARHAQRSDAEHALASAAPPRRSRTTSRARSKSSARAPSGTRARRQ